MLPERTPVEAYHRQAVRYHFRVRHMIGGANFAFARREIRKAIRIIRREQDYIRMQRCV